MEPASEHVSSEGRSGGAAYSLTGWAPSVWEVEDVARRARPVRLASEAVAAIERAHAALGEALSGDAAIYGVNTGFGSLARNRLPADQLAAVQHNLIRSHSAGMGEPLPEAVVRAMLFLLACSLSRGHSGVRAEVVELIAGMLNAGVTPVVPETGSVGASGDLAPLAHCALVMIGEGEAMSDGCRKSGAEALAGARLRPIVLGPKEGLALVNGTHLMAARGALAVCETRRLMDAALVAAAMSIDGARATDRMLDPRLHVARNQPGQKRVADRLRALLRGSRIIEEHRVDDPRVQDPYSFRCSPQVLGAAWDLIEHSVRVIGDELGAVTDNPLVFPPETDETEASRADVISGGNFHGMPAALALDALTLALTHVAGVAERRVYYLLAAADPENPTNPHLSRHPGVESGLMMTQYTAAACCNELIGLANPASAANIPTCAGMEDYNSFGPRSATKAERAAELCRRVVAIELLCAAEAIEYQRPLTSGSGVERAHRLIREHVPAFDTDRPTGVEAAKIAALIAAGRFG